MFARFSLSKNLPLRGRCPEGAEGENLALARNISDSRTVLSPTACGRSPSGPDPSVAGATSPHTVGSHPRRGGQGVSTPFSGRNVGRVSISALRAAAVRRLRSEARRPACSQKRSCSCTSFCANYRCFNYTTWQGRFAIVSCTLRW